MLWQTNGVTDPVQVNGSFSFNGQYSSLAGEIPGARTISDLADFELGYHVNFEGTRNLLEACRRSPLIRQIVVASSDKAYGDQPLLPYTEDTSLGGTYPYDASKVCTDVLARSYAVSYQLPVAIVRCANIYGPGDLNWSRLIPGTIRSALEGQHPVIRSDGSPERDYLYLEDAVDGYLRVADSLPNQRGQAFNLGTAQAISALSLVREILATGGDSRLEPRILGQAKGEIDRQYLSAVKASRVLGWTPRTSLRLGLQKTVDWYLDYLMVGAGARVLEEALA